MGNDSGGGFVSIASLCVFLYVVVFVINVYCTRYSMLLVGVFSQMSDSA